MDESPLTRKCGFRPPNISSNHMKDEERIPTSACVENPTDCLSLYRARKQRMNAHKAVDRQQCANCQRVASEQSKMPCCYCKKRQLFRCFPVILKPHRNSQLKLYKTDKSIKSKKQCKNAGRDIGPPTTLLTHSLRLPLLLQKMCFLALASRNSLFEADSLFHCPPLAREPIVALVTLLSFR